MADQDTMYWHLEATKFAQLLSEKELALNTSQVEAIQLRQRIAELEHLRDQQTAIIQKQTRKISELESELSPAEPATGTDR